MRQDIFSAKKSVHINLDKDVHLALREKLLRFGVTMQDLFHDIAETIVEDTPRNQRIIENVAKKKLLRQLTHQRNETRSLGELDSDALYSLLEGSNDRQDAEE